MTLQITGLVNTWNAAATLASCLESLREHVDELVVVDMESTDDTVAIAASFGARVLSHEPLGFVEPAREFGVRAASYDWILILDADEVIPLSLGVKLREIAENDEADVVVFTRRNYLFGEVPENGPLSPRVDRHRRFFKRDMLVHSTRIHEPAALAPNARQLVLSPLPELSLVHFAYVDISEWLIRSDRYTTIEARSLLERSGAAPSSPALLWHAVRTFFRKFIREHGYKDGWRGLHVSLLLAHYQLITELKAQQLAWVGESEGIRDHYRDIAARLNRPDGPAV